MGAACCSSGLVPPSAPLVAGVSPTLIEYATDTTRTMASLIFSGAAQRYPDIKFIFSHAGGAAPFLVERFEQQAQMTPDVTPRGARWFLERFFYDTAQAANPYALGTLVKLVPPTQILFGSDGPWRAQKEQLIAMDGLKLGGSTTSAIRFGNARRILPHFALKRGSVKARTVSMPPSIA
jgi:6-methylsalicylate decarboxylase